MLDIHLVELTILKLNFFALKNFIYIYPLSDSSVGLDLTLPQVIRADMCWKNQFIKSWNLMLNVDFIDIYNTFIKRQILYFID